MAALNKNLANHEIANPLLNASRAKNKTLMSPPIELYQTGEGFTTYSPLYKGNTFLGWLNTVYRIRQLFEKFPDAQMKQNGIRIYDDKTGRVIMDRRPPENTGTPVSSGLELFDQKWHVEVYPKPTPGWMSVLNKPITIFSIAAALALLVSLLYLSRIRAGAQAKHSLDISRRDNLLLRSVVHDLGNQLHSLAGHMDMIRMENDSNTMPPSPDDEHLKSIAQTI